MPELPEVETVTRVIRPFLERRLLQKLVIRFPGVIAGKDERSLRRQVEGQTIRVVRRRAKLICLELDGPVLAVHLKMTGRLLTSQPAPEEMRYVTAELWVSGGQRVYFKDVRKFGRLFLFDSPTVVDSMYGPEPLSEEFTATRLEKLVLARKRQLKPFLLDQQMVAGLGNIYVDEALWMAKLHPLRLTSTLDRKAIKRLHAAIQEVLTRSIDRNGTTFQSFYFGDDASGSFREELSVFGRTGLACPRCKSPIVKTRVAQRGTHLCLKCQPAPKAGKS